MKSVWDANPGVEVFYAFEDGNCFTRLSDAEAYKKLTGNDFKKVTKEKPQEKPKK